MPDLNLFFGLLGGGIGHSLDEDAAIGEYDDFFHGATMSATVTFLNQQRAGSAVSYRSKCRSGFVLAGGNEKSFAVGMP